MAFQPVWAFEAERVVERGAEVEMRNHSVRATPSEGFTLSRNIQREGDADA